MSRVLVVGMGVPAFVAWRRHAGPGLRAAHFAAALAAAGHDVLLLAVLAEHEARPAGASRVAGVTLEFVTEKELLSAPIGRGIDDFAPQAVVGVTVYAGSLAARLARDLPLWVDVFGDILAEAQAKAAVTGSDWAIVHFWTLLRSVLEAGDRFSAVSTAQAHALVGQLGLAGRLSRRTVGEEMVAVIPCSASLPAVSVDRADARRRLGLADGDFVLLASGGVNTWFDVETFCRGVKAALCANPRLRLVVTGGEIPGHDEASHAALVAGLGGVDPSRLRLLGWIDSTLLPAVYAAADLGLLIERPVYERTLGAENRVIEWLAHGLPSLTTACSESGRLLVSRGLALGCRPGDAEDLERVLLRVSATAARGESDLAAMAGQGRDWVAAERSADATAAALLAWCAEPRFAGDRGSEVLVRLGLPSHPETSIEMLEAYVAGLSASDVLRRGLRWAWRRALTGAAAALAALRFRARGGRW